MKLPYKLIKDPNKQEIDSMLTATIEQLKNIRFNLRQDNANIESFKPYTIVLYPLCQEEYKSYMESSYFKENELNKDE
jgi:hypothetical protein